MKHTCTNCNTEFELHSDLEPHKFANKTVCEECYYKLAGDIVEQHPIVSPRHIHFSKFKQ